MSISNFLCYFRIKLLIQKILQYYENCEVGILNNGSMKLSKENASTENDIPITNNSAPKAKLLRIILKLVDFQERLLVNYVLYRSKEKSGK